MFALTSATTIVTQVNTRFNSKTQTQFVDEVVVDSKTTMTTTQTNTMVIETTTETTTSTTQKTTTTTKTSKSSSTTKKTTKTTQAPQKTTDDNLYVLSHIIYAEAGGCSDNHQLAVGSVVLNRVKDKRFPNTIYGVVFQKGQYSPTWNGSFYKTPDKRAVKNATYLLENGSILPEGVIYQAEFKQGEVYKKMGNTYFCYG